MVSAGRGVFPRPGKDQAGGLLGEWAGMSGILERLCQVPRVRQNHALNVPCPDSGVSAGSRAR